ncbi:MFS transporter [Clostridium botulinum C]|uniref:MFS transporter n=2 Tax=Clostridium botulinum TaxID=1491 RepID=A0A9Q4TPD1_CLOBO|nr:MULTISPECIES: MFS transporter [Clostridium]EGO88346.1 MFS transporter [Clostridium botulinum C str. Stockholm]AYF53792.1 MFS transporter [Clostridium novyi]KEI08847.1 MFS transporter [Clostridium sp. K25]MCD3195221.1 MFS transporter [Clostridium botulinum C]MCD3200561.1 MFS transporter [Clostridium botulinum C]
MGFKHVMKEYAKLPKSIIAIFFARIINSLGGFVFPFLTIYLTEKMGMTSDRVGTFMLIAALGIALGSLLGGKLSDIIGRKKVILIFQAMSAISLIPCGFYESSMITPWLLILSGFFGGAVQPASSAMVADLTNTKNRQEAFSLLYLGINVGVAVGPLIAGILYKKYLKWIFWGDAITTLTSLLLIIFLVKETIHNNNEEEISKNNIDEKTEEGNVFMVILKRPYLFIFSLVSLIYSLVYAQSGFIIPLQVKRLFPDTGAMLYGSLMSVNAIVVVSCTFIVIHLTRKNTAIFNMVLAGIFYAIGFGMLFYIHEYKFFVVSTIVWTIGEILALTNEGVYIANHTPMSHRGRVNSIIPLISGAGYAIGPKIMGAYIKNRTINSAWIVVGILAVVSAIMMYILYKFEVKESKY